MGLIREKNRFENSAGFGAPGRFRKAVVFFLAVFTPLFLCGQTAYGQTAYGQTAAALFSAEVQSLEKKLSSAPGPAEKNRALRDIARLMELSGNVEAAARAWNEAARALPSDYDALVRSGVCFAAIGEFDSALRIVGSVSRVAAAGEPGLRARYIGAQVEAFRSGETSALSSLLQDAAFSAYKPGIYYSIWKISGDDASRNRLLREFPQSPEALALKDGSAVSAAPTALWLLGIPSGLPPPVLSSGQAAPEPPPEPAASPASAPAAGPVLLQAGLFGLEENARTLAARLRNAGFAPVVSIKTINGTAYWAVGILPGSDYNTTILRLKDAGFEAFPVY